MIEITRAEKLAAAQRKLKKFRDTKGRAGYENGGSTKTAAAYFSSESDFSDPFNSDTISQHSAHSDRDTRSGDDVFLPMASYFQPTCGTDEFTRDQVTPTVPDAAQPVNATFFLPRTPEPGKPPPPPDDSPTVFRPVSPRVSSNGLEHSSAAATTETLSGYSPHTVVPLEIMNKANDREGRISPRTPTATTEKVLQLSQQLTGLLHTSEHLTTSLIGTEHYSSSFLPCYAQASSLGPNPGSSYAATLTQPSVDSSGCANAFLPHRSLTPNSLPTVSSTGGNYTRELEDRNVELAALLEKRTRAHERLVAKLTTVEQQSNRLASQAAADRDSLVQSANRDLARAQEQIRAHAQTIGVLVAEKTELQTKITHLERLADTRSEEITEINDRLQSVRLKAAESERSLTTFKTEHERATNENITLRAQLEQLRLESKRDRLARENLQTDIQTAYSKMNAKDAQVNQLEITVQELKRKLELAEVYAHQLMNRSTDLPFTNASAGEEAATQSREAWKSERSSLVDRLQELESVALQANKDRGRLESQYKSLVSQMESQASELRSQLTTANQTIQELQLNLDESRRRFREKEDEMVALLTEQPAYQLTTVGAAMTEDQTTVLTDRVEQLESLTRTQQEEIDKQTRELITAKEQVASIEAALREKDAQLADRDSVLQTATTERATLSRAMEQNRSLKQQLTELQDAFVTMSNQNMELTNKLQHEQHALQESSTIQHDFRGQLERLQQHCAKREAEFAELQRNYDGLLDRIQTSQQTEVHVQHVTLNDSNMDHSHGSQLPRPSEDSDHQWMSRIQTLQETIGNLTNRAELLDSLSHRIDLAYKRQLEDGQPNESHQIPSDDPLELFAAYDRLIQSAQTEQAKAVASQADQNRQHLAKLSKLPSIEQWEALQVAHTQLEAKFLSSMQKLSDFSDERSRLEAVIQQLEMEAATVGEYVTLFAHRRAAAAKRAQAREQLLGRLVDDRKRLRTRLNALWASASGRTEDEVSKDVVSTKQLENSTDGMASDQCHSSFLTEFQCLLNDINPHEDEVECEEGDEDAPSQSENGPMSNLITLEQLRQQMLQHDCPHCQCCVGTLLEV